MKPGIITGVLLIVFGVAIFTYQGITYTTRERVVDIGPVHVTAEKTNKLPLPFLLGGVALVGGIALLMFGSKKP